MPFKHTLVIGDEIYKMHHDLDIHPIPEKVLYINELGIADTAFYYDTEDQHQKALTGRTRTNGGILAVRIEEHLHSKKV